MGSGEKLGGGGEKEFYDWYETGVKSLADLEKLSPDKQLKYVNDVFEAGTADMAYAFVDGMRILRGIANDKNLPPLIRLSAKDGDKLNPNSDLSLSTQELHDWQNDEKLRETYGYTNVVMPEEIPYGLLTKEEEAMSEEEVRAALKALEEERAKLPDSWFWSNSKNHEIVENLYTHQTELEFALQRLYFLANQDRLHREFPALPKDAQLVKIASDAAATIKFEQKYDERESLFAFSSSLDLISDSEGHIVPTSELGKLMNTDSQVAKYVGALYGSRNVVEDVVNVDLTTIPLKSQLFLLKFMSEANNERFDNLCNSLQKVENQDIRRKVLENFVAADFGEDFGDALLDIVGSERLDKNEKERVLDTISSCRESVEKVTDLYAGFDNGDFAKEYARASNERLTDAVTVFRQIAKNGVAEADLDWVGKPRFDFNKAIEALEYEAKSLEIISGTLEDVKSGVDGAFAEVVLKRDEFDQRLNRTFYNLYSPQHGYVLLYTRQEGSHSFDPMTEYGKVRSKYREDSVNAGVEASISLITNPVNPFSLPSPFRPDRHAVKDPRFYDPITMDKVSAIRLDREGRAPGMAADDPSRDPINDVGMVSVDLAAIGDRADTPSGKIARLLSLGGKLREEASGIGSSLNHNTRWFNQDSYGTADGFKELVGYIDKMVLKWCLESKPGNRAESFTRKMKQGLGKKALQTQTTAPRPRAA